MKEALDPEGEMVMIISEAEKTSIAAAEEIGQEAGRILWRGH